MSDPNAPNWTADDGAPDIREDTPGYLVWLAGVRGSDFANQLGAAIDGALSVQPPLDWADVMTAAQRIATHGGHPQELTDDVRTWVRHGTPGKTRAVRMRREAPAVVGRPEHCGRCDPQTRLTLTDPPARCPACHPLTQAVRADGAA